MIHIRKEITEYTLQLELLKLGEWFTYCGDIFIKLDRVDAKNINVLHVSQKAKVALKPDTIVKPIADKNINITVKVE